MYPGILILHPDIAEGGMLKYRFDRTQGASLKAKSYNKGYQGFMFPWESAFSGQETCPTSAATGQLEQHITGDIAFAIKQYWDLTKDINWLKSEGFPVLYGISQFWASRVVKSGDLYEINGVIPPDEYAVNIDNSVFTNVVAGMALNFTVQCGALLNFSTPSQWTEIASNIKIPIDSKNNIHLEYDGYNGGTIKQADVVLLGFPLSYPMSEQMRYNDLEYYYPRTDPNGPAMTYSMHVVGFLELGMDDKATSIWPRAWANIKAPFDVWTETPTGGAVNFITGAGGFLQAVLFGYGGIRLEDTFLSFDPKLPPKVTYFKIRQVYYLGNDVDVSYNQTTVIVSVFSNGTPLYLQDSKGQRYQLDQPVVLNRGKFFLAAK
eukprot:TRINITY_DN2608_c0_g1_i2.p1 TRINITY_DN2608_c0_g1~~TRINITY_DN2608_c0_g1_i2.p1  ORF type:complete len:415 (+),score=76.41 TRINITY_DN2608_c0_g1_i2:115-1245(+)